MKALSLWQPWATLIAINAKHYETRSWQTSYRGDLLIHAAMTDKALGLSFQQPILDALVLSGIGSHNGIVNLPLGAFVCIARLVDVVRVERIRNTLSRDELAFGDYGDGRFAWHLADVRVFDPPLPWRGAQGLFDYNGPLP